MWLVSFPLFAAVTSPVPARLGILDWLGTAVFLLGLGIESVADAQLAAFKSRSANKGSVLDTGLWRYSRHPNYFGESVIWIGVAVWAINVPGGWATLFGPALMIWLIVRVSGVRMLDALLAETKPGYADYMGRTSAFIPWPPARNDRGPGEFSH
jgi:steroid 5-alpha reductase family enzyme